jgi:hypothetical protein
MSAVDPAALASFNLVPTGTVPIVTPSTGASPHFAKQYDVSIMFPTGFQIGALGVCACQLRDQGINALFGRDVLAKCLFQYDGKASRYILAF